ncbi:MAG: class I SAM-dependent methyltransferase [Ferrovibrio sp.]|uniref:class I SAM-dependent methyltransferase n=1 Tax=Ferrovibrio sp. TaxID=1917215 RepID=UPI00391C1B82
MDKQDFEAYADLKRFNTKIAETWETAFVESLSRIGKPAVDITFLDFGCGDGKYFNHLLTKYGLTAENLHGVEVSARRIERCHEIGWLNAILITSGAELPYPDQSFDIINMMEVIEHIPKEQGLNTIKNLRRLLRPGGILLISTPNYPIKRFYDLYDAIFHGFRSRLFDDPTHVTFFTHSRLSSLLTPHFKSIEPRRFKPGFLYKRIPVPFLEHKLFYLCQS